MGNMAIQIGQVWHILRPSFADTGESNEAKWRISLFTHEHGANPALTAHLEQRLPAVHVHHLLSYASGAHQHTTSAPSDHLYRCVADRTSARIGSKVEWKEEKLR